MSQLVLVSSLVVWLAVAPKAVAQQDRTFIVVSGQTSDAVTYHFRGQTVGYPPTISGGYCLDGTVGPNVDALGVRDALVPDIGLDSGDTNSPCVNQGGGPIHPYAKRVRLSGNPAIETMGAVDLQWWVSADNSSWKLLEPSLPVTVHGITFTLLEPGTVSAIGSIPAIGGVGLGVLVAILLGIGAFIIVKRRQASTA